MDIRADKRITVFPRMEIKEEVGDIIYVENLGFFKVVAFDYTTECGYKIPTLKFLGDVDVTQAN